MNTSSIFLRRNILANNLTIFHELISTAMNTTATTKYIRTMMITLKLSLQCGFSFEASDSIGNLVITTFIIFAGFIYFSYVLLRVVNLLIAEDIPEYKYEKVFREIDAFAFETRLPKSLHERVKKYYQFKYRGQYFNENYIEKTIPESLRKEIMMHTCFKIISRVSLFSDLPKNIIENIVRCLKSEIYFPGDILVEANTAGDSMFFIASGSAAVITAIGSEVAHLTDNSHFGEIALLIKVRTLFNLIKRGILSGYIQQNHCINI